MNQLTLTVAPEDDGTAELRGSVQGAGFAGSGSAWFNVEALKAFCTSLTAYPLDPKSPPFIAGGYFNKHGGKLRETHLAIRITPFDGCGALQVSVQIADPSARDEPVGRRRTVSTWFVVGYNDLIRFQSRFAKVLAGECDEAVLTATPT